MKNRITAGKILVVFTIVAGIVSLIRFQMWGAAHNGADMLITVGLIAAIALDLILMIRDNNVMIILATVGYTIAAIRLLTNSVGSFVDEFQGLNMFGDATQVGTIISIAAGMMVCVLLSIIASFMNRVKG